MIKKMGFMVDERGNTRYPRSLNVHLNGFKFASSTYVLFLLNVYHLSHISQVVRFPYYLYSSVEASLLAAPCCWGPLKAKAAIPCC